MEGSQQLENIFGQLRVGGGPSNPSTSEVSQGPGTLEDVSRPKFMSLPVPARAERHPSVITTLIKASFHMLGCWFLGDIGAARPEKLDRTPHGSGGGGASAAGRPACPVRPCFGHVSESFDLYGPHTRREPSPLGSFRRSITPTGLA